MNFPPLEALLPHRAPLLLLRGIVSHAAGQTVCAARFDAPDAALLGDGTDVPATLALELVAQTMAVHDGLRRVAERRVAASRGLLLGSRRFDLFVRALPLGVELRVVTVGDSEELSPPGGGGLVRFTGWVEDENGRVLAAGDVTVLEHRPETALPG